jgi:hypothetical protein
MKKYISLLENNSKPLVVKPKPVQPKTEPAPLVHISESYESSPLVKKIVRNIMERKEPEPPKQRNPVAKNANAALGGGAAGKHKDKKKEAKQGIQKHKGQSLDENDKGDFKRRELEHELGHETRSGEVYIDGKYWKTFDTFKQAQNVARSLERKGKRATARMLESKKPKKTAQEKLSAAVDKERKKNEPATRRAKQELDAAMPSKSLAEGRVCPQCGSSKCSCPPGKCKCKPVAGFKTKMQKKAVAEVKAIDPVRSAEVQQIPQQIKPQANRPGLAPGGDPKLWDIQFELQKQGYTIKTDGLNGPATFKVAREAGAMKDFNQNTKNPKAASVGFDVGHTIGSGVSWIETAWRNLKQGFRDGQDGLEEDKDPCWKNYKMVGTKKKGSKTVPNCVPKESRVGEAQNAAQQAAIAIAKKKKKAVAEDMRTKADFRREIDDTVTDFLNKGGKIKEVPPNKVRVKPGQSLASKHIGSKIEAGRVVGKDRKINSKQPVVSTEHMGETQLDELDRPSGKLYIIITADNAGAPHVFGDFGSFPQDVMHKIAKRGTRDKSGAKTKLKIDFLFDDFRTTIQHLRTIFRDLDFIGAEAAEFIIKSSALRSDQGEDVKHLRDYIQAGDDRRMKMYQAPGDDEEEGEPTGGNILRIDPETGAARRVVGVKPQTQMGGHAVAQPTTFKYTLLKTELMPKLRDMGFKFDGNQIILRAEQRDKLKNMLGAQFQSVFGQKDTFKEGGEKYKIKSTGSDVDKESGERRDYYISPSTGKKVYKDGVKRGDHESPNSGDVKKQVKEFKMSLPPAGLSPEEAAAFAADQQARSQAMYQKQQQQQTQQALPPGAIPGKDSPHPKQYKYDEKLDAWIPGPPLMPTMEAKPKAFARAIMKEFGLK